MIPKTVAPRSIWSRAILHVDMDAFYVHVYLLSHPEDAGIPLIIGNRPEQRGVVASASYEARALGIHAPMPTKQAVQLCPELKIVNVSRPKVRECSDQIMGILAEYGALEQLSIDEAYIDLTHHLAPVRLSDTIRHRLKAETGLPASVGLASNKLIAKVASAQKKPEGCTIVMPNNEAKFLAPLPASVLWGVGQRTTEQLTQLGIVSCGQLAQTDLLVLQAIFGKRAEELLNRAKGIDSRPVIPNSGPTKSISVEQTFEEDMNDAGFLQARLQEMCIQVGQNLRQQGLEAHTVTVKFRLADFTTFTRQKTVRRAISTDEQLNWLAQLILAENWQPAKALRLLGMGVNKLTLPPTQQLSFLF